MTIKKMIDRLVFNDIEAIMQSALDEDYKYLIDCLTGEVKGYNQMSEKELSHEYEERFEDGEDLGTPVYEDTKEGTEIIGYTQ